MDKNILKIILRRKESFVPLIFTEKQFNILGKYNNHVPLSNAEKKSLYTSIKKKMEALSSFSTEQKDIEYWINNTNEIMPRRLEEAKKLIDSYSEKYNKVFISGSFLFAKEFRDIDIFIVREKGYKEAWDGNRHIIFLTEKRLAWPIFQSAAKISIGNFALPSKMTKKKPTLSEIMSAYHEAVIELMRKEKKPDLLRRFTFDYYLFCKNRLLSGKELNDLSKSTALADLDNYVRELCLKLFSRTYLYVEIHDYIKTLKDSIESEKPNEHLIRYKKTYEELIYGKHSAKAEAA